MSEENTNMEHNESLISQDQPHEYEGGVHKEEHIEVG